MNNFNGYVFAGGMMYSGSTLQYQIAAELAEQTKMGIRLGWSSPDDLQALITDNEHIPGIKVIKSHNCHPIIGGLLKSNKAKALYIYRDLRDVTVSAMRKHDLTFAQVFSSDTLSTAIKQAELWESMPNTLIMKYEDMIGDLQGMVRAVAYFLDIKATLFIQNRIMLSLTLENQRKKIAQLDPEISYDPNTLLHHFHIGKNGGKPGQWKIKLLTPDVDKIILSYGDWLRDHGYHN